MDVQGRGVEVTLRGDGLTLSRTISEQEAIDIIAYVLHGEHAHRVMESRPNAGPQVGPLAEPVAVSSVEFLQLKRPQTNPERMLTLGRYLEYAEAQRPFSKAALRQMFEVARLPMPKNVDRDLAIAIQRGWLTELRDGGLQVTQLGWDLLGADDQPSRFLERRYSSRP
ncbi:hypothetical protein HY374_00310 [Candidatus Berkelbacteria bacterium]|nr:hypothetical protein [Candidatus Berkelbacteria bacterium]